MRWKQPWRDLSARFLRKARALGHVKPVETKVCYYSVLELDTGFC